MDTRDPTRVPQSEELKSVLLDLEVVGRNFEVESVLAWWGARNPGDGERRKRWLEKGSVRGLEAFSSDPVLFQALRNLRNRYPPRVQLEPLRDAVLESARELGVSAGVGGVLERVFEEWLESLKRIGEDGRKRPLRIWQRDLSDRLRQAPPVVARFKRRTGLRLYRVDQAVSLGLLAGSTVHFFGVSAAFFEPRDEGTEWLSSRDLEILSRDFGLPSRKEREGERRDSFLAWIRASEECPWFHEFLHDGNGVEQESLELILGRIPAIQREPTLKLPVHPWILPSLTSRLKPPVTEVRIHSDRTEFPISFLNAMGDCPFTAYARHLLDLVDERDPDFDLSGDAHGNLLHTAIELLLSSGGSLTPREAFDQAFARTATPAWLRSERLFRALRTKTTGMLEAFLESEREYRERSGTRILSQEEAISLTRGGVTFQGRMDRVDEHEDGLVLMDYKTGSSLPSATQTRQTGKGLQLPAYALALRESKGREVISAQYLQIRPRKTQRNLGFLFQRWNKGKKADEVAFPLSTARSNSGSLIPDDPEALWAEMEGRIGDLIARLRAGEFPARPADPEDCQRCRYSGVCGRERAVIG
jgi:RecB family exonuclease